MSLILVTMWWYRVDLVQILTTCPIPGYVLPNFPRCPVPVSMSYRYQYQLRYRRANRYRYGIDVLPNLPKCPVPVFDVVPNLLMGRVTVLLSYQTCRSVRYRYCCRTEVTEVSGTGIDVVPKLPKCLVPVISPVCLGTYHTEHTLAKLSFNHSIGRTHS